MCRKNICMGVSTFFLIAGLGIYSLFAMGEPAAAAKEKAETPSLSTKGAAKHEHGHDHGGAAAHGTATKTSGKNSSNDEHEHGDGSSHKWHASGNSNKGMSKAKGAEGKGHDGHDHKAMGGKGKGHDGHDHKAMGGKGKGHDGHDHKAMAGKGKGDDGHGHKAMGGKGKGHDGHGHGHEESNQVSLTDEQQKEFTIKTSVASSGRLATHITRPAEVKFNGDRIVHVIPRVSGTVKSVSASEGQYIEEGALMAVLHSRELADAKAEYLASIARARLAKENFERSERLSRRKILAERQFQEARTKYVEAQIARRVAAQKLRALGLDAKEISNLPKAPDASLPLFYLKAPFSGIIVERHMVRGETRSVDKEALTSKKAAFVIADLRKVWVDISIYPNDFKSVRRGQVVRILLKDGGEPVVGKILFVSSHIQEETRTGFARVVLDNSDGRFHPGVYFKAEIATRTRAVKIRIPNAAVQTGEHGKVVFVKESNGFVPRPVTLGEKNHAFVEVASGLKPGETYVSSGAFTLKAQLGKAGFGDGHNH